jgi:hypothetical protein
LASSNKEKKPNAEKSNTLKKSPLTVKSALNPHYSFNTNKTAIEKPKPSKTPTSSSNRKSSPSIETKIVKKPSLISANPVKTSKVERKEPTELVQNELTYSLDSDDSIVIDNLISDPNKLKEKLKQNKMDREHLNQLQENYLRLLEQYAEAENFIDAFRLGIGFNATNGNNRMQNSSSNNNNNSLQV